MPSSAPAARLNLLGTVELTGCARAPDAVVAQPKRLGLLAYLAAATPYGFHRRDTLLALFWPELPREAALRALRQAIHFLRRALGADAIVGRGAEDVALHPDALSCDVRDFGRALDERRFPDALALYRGDLLRGFHVPRVSAELDHWLDAARGALRDRAALAASALADGEAARGEWGIAAHWARTALDFAPSDECVLRRLLTLLDRAGDRVGAVRIYEDFRRRVAEELEVDPSAETRALAARLRDQRVLGGPFSRYEAGSVLS